MLEANPGKQPDILVEGEIYRRLPIRTHLVTEEDSIEAVARGYAAPLLRAGDILFLSEKCVACTQGRAIPVEEIRPRPLAVFLAGFVTKTPHGIGLGMPQTMEMALRECGTVRILAAALCGAVGKLLGRRGWFYVVAGTKASAIDGPTKNTIPPYNRYVVLAPEEPDRVAEKLAQAVGHPVAIVDCNDLGGKVLGASAGVDRERCRAILRDNPLGQCREQTPMGIIRPLNAGR